MRTIVWTLHAAMTARERAVETRWAELTINSPERLEPDEGGRKRMRAYRRIPEFGDRWLRVVYEDAEETSTIVTVFFDRNAGRRF